MLPLSLQYQPMEPMPSVQKPPDQLPQQPRQKNVKLCKIIFIIVKSSKIKKKSNSSNNNNYYGKQRV